MGGGVVVYIRDNINVTRRFDLEMDNLEAVWLQLKLQGKKVLFGTFYIPPNSNQDIWLKLENTFDLALNDNSVDYIMTTGDFNENQLNSSNSKIKSLLAQFSLNQLIDTPTHFTEHSSSLIDLFMTNNVNYVTYCGVGPPLQDLTRYHCPIIGFLNIPKISKKKLLNVRYGYMIVGIMINLNSTYRMLTGILLFLLIMSMILRQI